MEDQKDKSLYELKGEIIEDIATAAIENDEPNNEELEKADALEKLNYADGKQDEIDLIEEKKKSMEQMSLALSRQQTSEFLDVD